MAFFRLIRWQNLLMIAAMQLIFRYGFLELRGIALALADWQYAILVMATVAIAAAGYIINDIFDQETDHENRPERRVVGRKISEPAAYNYYIALNVIGVGAGFYLANLIGKPGFAALFIVIAATLYLYASSFKQSLLTGNFIVALLVALSVIIIGIFDLYPILTAENRGYLGVVFQILVDYAIFAFIINFLREITKDLEDVNGDYNQGMNTLPIALGVSRTAKIVFWLSLIPTALLLWYINQYFIANNLFIVTAYALLFVVAPLIYFSIKMWTANKKDHFTHLALILKIILFFGILSALVLSYNINFNVKG